MSRFAVVLAAALIPGPAGASERAYVVDSEHSVFRILVGRSGLFSFAGHSHEVAATGISGRIIANPEEIGRSTVVVRFPSAELRVSGKGEPAADVPKVQARLEGPDVLDVARYAEITFRSTSVEGREAGGVWNLRVAGELSVRGVVRPLSLPLRVALTADAIEASGQVVLKQSDFGIQPVSVAGVVKVKDELGCDYKIVGRLEH